MYCVRKITDKISYIGASDRRIALFENVYPVPEGTSYNSYFIDDSKTAVIDTVDRAVSKQFFENIRHMLAGRSLDYVIVNHMEPDHAASLEELVLRYPEVTVVCNDKTKKMINQFFEFDIDARVQIVAEGDTVCTGAHTFKFFMAPMVHWPEVMVEYEKSEKILFSADGFGKFGALDTDEDWACEARRYYFNIVGKYGAQVQALLKKASALDIQTICPLHGPILKENLEYYIGKYMTWSSYEPEDKGILIAYASIHGNTAKAAKKLKEILESKGAEKVAITDLARDDMAEAIEDAFRYDRMILAAASYDAGVFPCMEDFLHHLKSKAYQKRTVGLLENGSWAPSAARTMKAVVEQMKNVSIVEPVVTIKSTMKDSDIENMEKLGDAIINA